MNSNRAQLPRLWVICFAAMAVLGSGALALQLLQGTLGPGRIQRANPLDTKRRLAWSLHRDKQFVDTVVLGNSTADQGIDPSAILEQSSGSVRVFNGALAGYDFEVHRPFYQHVYEPLLAPRRVILAVSMMDANVNERGFRRNVEQLLASSYWPLYLNQAPSGFQGVLYERLALFRHGLTLQHFLRLTLRVEMPVDPYGVSRTSGTPEQGADLRQQALSHFADFEVGGRSLASLDLLIRELQEKGKDILVVNMPLSPRLFEEVDGFAVQYSAYVNTLDALCIANGIALVDAHEALALCADAFADEYHANEVGRRELSRLVVAAMM